MDDLSLRVEALESTIQELKQENQGLEHAVHDLNQRNRRVERLLYRWRAAVGAILVLSFTLVPLTGRAASTQYDTLRALLAHLTVQGDDFFLDHANLHIRNGTGATNDAPANGLGNLIIGYNEPRGGGQDRRTGSHNLVIGLALNYTSSGGMVVGDRNEIDAPGAVVAGGYQNVADGYGSAVSGGQGNRSHGWYSSISGGASSLAWSYGSSVCGGIGNLAGDRDPRDPTDRIPTQYPHSYSPGEPADCCNKESGWTTVVGGIGNWARTRYFSVVGQKLYTDGAPR